MTPQPHHRVTFNVLGHEDRTDPRGTLETVQEVDGASVTSPPPQEGPCLAANVIRRNKRAQCVLAQESLSLRVIRVASVSESHPERCIDEDHLALRRRLRRVSSRAAPRGELVDASPYTMSSISLGSIGPNESRPTIPHRGSASRGGRGLTCLRTNSRMSDAFERPSVLESRSSSASRSSSMRI